MKKYLFGLSAIVLAIVFSAYTKPSYFATEVFSFSGDHTSVASIQNLANWSRISGGAAQCLTNVDDKVCEIVVNDQFYTGTGASAVLNATDPAGSDLQMTIVADDGQLPGSDKIVVASGTTGTPKNADIP